MTDDSPHYIGVDVGTGSVRAGLVSTSGLVVSQAVREISRLSPAPLQYVQSSSEIWAAVRSVVRSVLAQSGVSASEVRGLGLAGTCSLVVAGQEMADTPGYDIIMWMDHRAEQEADIINQSGHPCSPAGGGGVSLEMQLPKLLWLKRHQPAVFSSGCQFYDLPDWLVFRATGQDVRSLCSAVCKWNYGVERDGRLTGWNKDFLSSIGLSELCEDDHARIGSRVEAPGEAVGTGLSEAAALELGLVAGTAVSTSLIDAHAGALGMLGCSGGEVEGRLGLITGTSTCHLLLSPRPLLVPGVWGPFLSAILPGLWLMEGGQSSTGGLIDHVISSHRNYGEVREEAARRGCSVYTLLEERLEQEGMDTTRDLHVYPDYHGNRSPLAEPSMKGAVVGLTLQTDLPAIYLATIQAVCYGTRHVIETITARGHSVTGTTVCGGITNSRLFLQTQADVLQLEVAVPQEKESVLLGAAMLGMAASGDKGDLHQVVTQVNIRAEMVRPCSAMSAFHDAKYRVFREMIKDQLKYRNIMENSQ